MKYYFAPKTLVFTLLMVVFTSSIMAQSRLYNSIKDDNRRRAERFLKRGDNPNGDGNPQYIPLIGAAELNYYHMVVLLLNYNADVNIQNHIGFTPLMEASIQRNNRILNYLINNGANLEMRANNGASALMVAVNAGNNRGARILLENEANPNITDNNGITPLMRAVESGSNIEIVRILVEHKADMTATDPNGNPVLMVYPYRNRIATHRELVNLGADVNIQNKEGQTPLIKAVLEGNLEMVRFFIENGGDRFKKDHSGASANDYAITQFEVRQYFESLDN